MEYNVETAPAGGGINRRNQVESAFKVYIYTSVAAAFFLSSSAILCQLMDYMNGERLLLATLALVPWEKIKGAFKKAAGAVCNLVPGRVKSVVPQRSPSHRKLGVHWQRSVWFMCGLASMVTYASLALGLAFLSAGYVSFGRHQSEYSVHWKVINIVGYSLYGIFTFVWLCLLAANIMAPDNFLGQDSDETERERVEKAAHALLRYLSEQQLQQREACAAAIPALHGKCSKVSVGSE